MSSSDPLAEAQRLIVHQLDQIVRIERSDQLDERLNRFIADNIDRFRSDSGIIEHLLKSLLHNQVLHKFNGKLVVTWHTDREQVARDFVFSNSNGTHFFQCTLPYATNEDSKEVTLRMSTASLGMTVQQISKHMQEAESGLEVQTIFHEG